MREAVAFGDTEGASCDSRLRDALHVACSDFVRETPEGLDARLGEAGGGLSEGKVQRLAIARAVFSNRPMLLLDEAKAVAKAVARRKENDSALKEQKKSRTQIVKALGREYVDEHSRA